MARVLLVVLALSGCPAPMTVDGGAGGTAAGGQSGGGSAGATAGGSSGGATSGGDAGTPDAGDPTAALYEPTHLVEVRVELAQADWEALRGQTRDLFTLLTGNCTAQPFPSPFTTFDATVTVDGTRLPQSTVKKKGFLGSLSANRPSLKLKFDANVPKQKVSGLDALTLNNAQQDPSVVRQCLGYALFRKAGLLAPRCNFAHVVVNGADLGIYANVEALDHDFIQRHFADDTGNLYEGTLSDFNPTFVNTFDLKRGTPDKADLNRVIAALNGPDADLLTRLSAVVDTDQFIDFWAMETLTRHWDGYSGNTNNFFVYSNPATGKFVFLPWGADAVFGAEPETVDDPQGPMLRGELTRRLYALPDVRARYLAKVRSLLDTVFVESELRSEVTRMENLIRPLAHPIQLSQLTMGLSGLRTFIDERRAKLTAALANPPAPVTMTRPSPCMYPIGRFESTFDTRWGTINAQNPFITGTASFQLSFDAGIEAFMYTGSGAGIDTTGNDGPKPGVNLVGAGTDGGFTAAVFRFDPRLYPPQGGPQPLDLFGRVGYVFRFSGGVIRPVGILGPGTIEFTQAATVDGGVVSGRVAGTVVTWPFGAGM